MSRKIMCLLCLLLCLTMGIASAAAVEDFTYTQLDDGTIRITGCNLNTEQITIPATIDGLNVSGIAADAFAACTAVKEIILPESGSLASAEAGAFPVGVTIVDDTMRYVVKADNTLEITAGSVLQSNVAATALGRSVTSIGANAFTGVSENWNGSVRLPEGLTAIGSNAFAATGMQEIYLPQSLTTLDAGALAATEGLQYVHIFGGVTALDETIFGDESGLTIYTTTDSAAAQYAEEHQITYLTFDMEDSTATLTGAASWLTDVAVPAKVLDDRIVYHVGASAFKDNTVLETIAFSSAIYEVRASAFSGCTSLRSVNTACMLNIGNYAFCNTALTEASFGEQLNRIGDHAFQGTALTEATLPVGMGYLGEYAFADCVSLATVRNLWQFATIYAGTFQNTALVGHIYMGDCGSILENAFADIPTKFTLVTKALYGTLEAEAFTGTEGVAFYAQEASHFVPYAEENGFPCVYFTCDSITYHATVTGFVGEPENVDLSTEYGPIIIVGLADNAFKRCTSLQSIILPETLTSLGQDVFYGCKALLGISIPAGVHTIPYRAFYNCIKLERVTLEEGVTTIGDMAFYGCDVLPGIELPDSLNSIGEKAFYSCNIFADVTLNEGLYSLGSEAFGYCTKLTAIRLPASLESVGSTPFKDSGLTTVTMAATKKSLPSGIFSECYKLTKVTLPRNMTSIGYGAFSHCEALKSITLPVNLEYLEGSAFEYCTSLESIAIPDGVMTVSYNAFYGCSALKEVTFDGLPESLGGYAFAGCTSLTTFQIPDSVNTLDYGVFSGCTALESIVIPDSVTSIGSSLFSGCTSLTDVTLTDTISILPEHTFSGCTALQTIELPDNITEIGNCAFYDCRKLETINFPVNLVEINGMAFQDCYSLTKVELGQKVERIADDAFGNCNIRELTLSKALGTLSGRAFYNCYSLEKVIIPEGITAISDDYFGSFAYGATMTLPASLESAGAYRGGLVFCLVPQGSYADEYCAASGGVYSAYHTEVIGEDASYLLHYGQEESVGTIVRIQPNEGVTALTIPAELEGRTRLHIGPGACATAGQALTSVTFPTSILTIGRNAFSGQPLTSLVIPEGVTSIGSGAFANCSKLTSVTLPSTLKHLSGFSSVPLASISIPASVTEIGDYAFASCLSLTSVTLPAGLEVIGDSAFYETRITAIDFPDGLKEIGSYAFAYTRLEDVVMPDSVTTLGGSAFYYCERLHSVKLSNGLTEIPDSAFYYCHSMTHAVMPSGLKTLGSNAFLYCSLIEYELPETLETIRSSALYGHGMYQTAIPASVTTIESGAFNREVILLVAEGTAGKNYILNSGHEYYEEVRLLEDGTAELLRFQGDIPTRFGSIPITSIAGNVTWAYLPSELAFPPTIEHIGEGAFSGLTGMNVTVAEGTGAHDFALTMADVHLCVYRPLSETTAELVSDERTINSSAYCVPESVAGLRITALAEDFMRNNTVFNSVYLTQYLKIIGDNAFADCTSLSNLYFNDASLASVGAGAFANAPVYGSLYFTEDLTFFGEGAFARTLTSGMCHTCYVYAGTPAEAILRNMLAAADATTWLYSYRWKDDGSAELMGMRSNFTPEYPNLPQSQAQFTSIGDNAWWDTCSDDLGLTITGNITSIGVNAFTDGKQKSYSLTLPEGLTYLGEGAFARTGIYSLYLPDSLTVIPDNAFADCSRLNTITLGKKVTSIGANAFRNSILGEMMTLPASLTHIGEGAFSGLLTNELGVTHASFVVEAGSAAETHFKAVDTASMLIYDRQTDGTAVLTGVRGVADLAALADRITFTGVADNLWAEKVTSVSLPDSVTRIGDNAFKDMANLTWVNIPAGLTSLGVNAFAGTAITNVNIPEGVTVIPDGAFANCTSLTSLSLHDGITSIGANAFSNAPITSVVYISPNVTAIGEGAFAGADCATFCVIEGTVGETLANGLAGSGRMIVRLNDNGTASIVSASLTTNAFTNMSVVIPGSIAGVPVTEICEGLFKGENRIEYVMLPSQLQVIGKDAFADCSNLYDASLPSTVTTLGENVFANTQISSVIIPAGVTEIPAKAYDNAPLNSLCFNGTAVRSIGDRAFSNGSNLYTRELTLPEGLEAIGSHVLENCNAYSLILPSTLRSISDQSFTNMYSLCSLSLSSSLESVGNNSLSGISCISSLTLPASLTSIGAGAFSSCAARTVTIPAAWTKIPDNAFNNWGELSTVSIPGTVTEIGTNAFSDCYSISSLTLSPNITKIGAGAFSGCTRLENLTLPDALMELGENAFSGCGVRALTTPANWTRIPDGAFSGWTSLNTVVIRDQVTEIGANAFGNCPALSSLTLSQNITHIGDGAFSVDPGPYYENPNGQLTSVVFPSSLVSIGKNCFSHSGLTDVTLPEGLKSIGDGSFSYLNGITLNLPDSLEEIGAGCFAMSGVYGSLTMPTNLKRIGDGAFSSNGITELILPEGLEYLGGFDMSTSLTSVTIPSTVTEIGNAFSCSALTSVVIPEGVKTIGQGAFGSCQELTRLTLPSTLESIGSYAFQSCGSLTSNIGILKNLTSIGDYAFSGTPVSGSIYLNPGISLGTDALASGYFSFYVVENSAEHEWVQRRDGMWFGDTVVFRLNEDGTATVTQAGAMYAPLIIPECFADHTVTAIADQANSFVYQPISLPDTITSIGANCFTDCSMLYNLTLPRNLTSLGEGCFQNIMNLMELVIPDGLTTIPANCFTDGRALTSLTLPQNLKSVGDNCFFGAQITELVFPEGMESIGGAAFGSCQALAEITLPVSLRSIGANAFGEGNYPTMHVVYGTVGYFHARNYGFSMDIAPYTLTTLPSMLESIEAEAFLGDTALTHVKLAENVTAIGAGAFRGCTNLLSVEIPNSATTIAEDAFEGCEDLVLWVCPGSPAETYAQQHGLRVVFH